MIGNAALREVVGADALAPIPRTDHAPSILFARLGVLSIVKIIHAGTQHFKRAFFVFELRTFVLTGDHDPRGKMRDTHRRRDLVDVLPACSA